MRRTPRRPRRISDCSPFTGAQCVRTTRPRRVWRQSRVNYLEAGDLSLIKPASPDGARQGIPRKSTCIGSKETLSRPTPVMSEWNLPPTHPCTCDPSFAPSARKSRVSFLTSATERTKGGRVPSPFFDSKGDRTLTDFVFTFVFFAFKSLYLEEEGT